MDLYSQSFLMDDLNVKQTGTLCRCTILCGGEVVMKLGVDAG